MDFTGDSQPTAHEPFEVWRKAGDGAEFVSRHTTLSTAQKLCVGRQGYFVRCRPWQAPTPPPSSWRHWVTPAGLISLALAGALAGWLIVRARP